MNSIIPHGTSLVAQSVKNLPPMQETQVQFLCQEDPLEKEMATHSSVLAWRIPMDRGMALEAGGPIREVTLVQEKKDEGLGGGQRRADLRDSSPGEMRILKTS